MEAFRIVRPAAKEIPVLVEIPHAGLNIDAPALETIKAPARCLARDADLYVDELYAGATDEGATMLISNVSRYMIDLNRAESDLDREAVAGAPTSVRATRGLVWRVSSDGHDVLVRALDRSELARRLDRVYRPYHAALEKLIDELRERFGYAIVIAGHSMPSAAPDEFGRAGKESITRADVVPGTQGRTTADARIIDAVDGHWRSAGYTVVHDDPYRGGYVTKHYGNPARNVHVVQVELARKLYMDEESLRRNAAADAIASHCRAMVRAVGALALSRDSM
jgi:N-formylglutamate amidohydrolase